MYLKEALQHDWDHGCRKETAYQLAARYPPVGIDLTADLICNPDIDFDATFDQYIKEWNEQGGAQWTQEINEYWQSR